MNFILIIICISAGIVLKRTHTLPENAHKGINAWLLNVALPAMALKFLPQIAWSTELILPLAMPFVIWFGAVIFVRSINKWVIPMNKPTQAGLIMVGGLSNTSFVGFPITQAYYGDAGLQIAVLCDQACFVVMAIFGVSLAVKTASGDDFSYQKIGKKLISFPPFIASVLAVSLAPYVNFSPILPLLDPLAATVVPMALFSVGLQLSLKNWHADIRLISVGLGYKLIIAPALILLLVYGVFEPGITAKATILEAGMASMVTGSILASDYDLNPKLANLILGIGIPISFLTTAVWYVLMEFLL